MSEEIIHKIMGKGKPVHPGDVLGKILYRKDGVGPGKHEAKETSMEETLEHEYGTEKKEKYHKKLGGY
jgi:hypothetical protein